MDIPANITEFHLLKHTDAYSFNAGITELMAEGWRLLYIDSTVHVHGDGKDCCVFLATMVKFPGLR
jgi:hypothetical protein